MKGFYRKAPGYRNAWKRLGFSEADIDSGRARFLDSIVACGSGSDIRTRGLLRPLHPGHGLGSPDWKAFAALAAGT